MKNFDINSFLLAAIFVLLLIVAVSPTIGF
jgi:hypothetical protein